MKVVNEDLKSEYNYLIKTEQEAIDRLTTRFNLEKNHEFLTNYQKIAQYFGKIEDRYPKLKSLTTTQLQDLQSAITSATLPNEFPSRKRRQNNLDDLNTAITALLEKTNPETRESLDRRTAIENGLIERIEIIVQSAVLNKSKKKIKT